MTKITKSKCVDLAEFLAKLYDLFGMGEEPPKDSRENICQKYGIYRQKNMNMVAVKNEIMQRGQSDPDLQMISKQLCAFLLQPVETGTHSGAVVASIQLLSK